MPGVRCTDTIDTDNQPCMHFYSNCTFSWLTANFFLLIAICKVSPIQETFAQWGRNHRKHIYLLPVVHYSNIRSTFWEKLHFEKLYRYACHENKRYIQSIHHLAKPCKFFQDNWCMGFQNSQLITIETCLTVHFNWLNMYAESWCSDVHKKLQVLGYRT